MSLRSQPEKIRFNSGSTCSRQFNRRRLLRLTLRLAGGVVAVVVAEVAPIPCA
jgi:hypothetical protein